MSDYRKNTTPEERIVRAVERGRMTAEQGADAFADLGWTDISPRNLGGMGTSRRSTRNAATPRRTTKTKRGRSKRK